MGLSVNQARLNVLTARKSDLELRLTILMNQTQVYANQKSNEIAEKTRAMTEYYEANKDKDDAPEFTETVEYAQYEEAMNELESADLRLTQQQEAAETEHQAVVAEEEQIQKLVDTNIKKSFGYFN